VTPEDLLKRVEKIMAKFTELACIIRKEGSCVKHFLTG
jgi:hypothetical protein